MFKGKTNIPVIFHNANYDIKCFISAFQKLKGDECVIDNIGGIPSNMEIYKSININVSFKNSPYFFYSNFLYLTKYRLNYKIL